MIERPTPGEQVAGIAGLALILTMFLFAWYGVDVPGVNGFDAFDAFDDWINIILVFAAFGGMALALAGSGSERSPVALSVVTTVLAGLGALVVLIYIISPPGVPSFGEAAVEIDMSREFGVFLGLIELVALTDRRLHGHAGGGRLLRRRRRSPLLRPRRRGSRLSTSTCRRPRLRPASRRNRSTTRPRRHSRLRRLRLRLRRRPHHSRLPARRRGRSRPRLRRHLRPPRPAGPGSPRRSRLRPAWRRR